MLILGIESSCDESAAAVVRDGYEVLSSVIHTQIALHAPHGGVVPEIASRSHIEKIPSVIRKAVEEAQIGFSDIDAVAVTYGPGLASSLLVGLSVAKGLAASLGKPLIGINHLHAHIQSAFLSQEAPKLSESLPLLALVVSGGHSAVVEIDEKGTPRILGQTLDDAAGEAFDKASKLLGLGYPGGPAIQKVSARADNYKEIRFPQGRISADNPALGDLDAEMCFSFSGLKTSLRTYLERNPPEAEGAVANIAAAYQEAIVDALAMRIRKALRRRKYKAFAVGGGVSLNALLRERLTEVAAEAKTPIYLPLAKYCGDNAAMIASLAGTGQGIMGDAAFLLDAMPDLSF